MSLGIQKSLVFLRNSTNELLLYGCYIYISSLFYVIYLFKFKDWWSTTRSVHPRILKFWKNCVIIENQIRCIDQLENIDQLERENSKILIITFGYEDKKVLPFHITEKTERQYQAILLQLIDKIENAHYALIKNLSSLLRAHYYKHKESHFFS